MKFTLSISRLSRPSSARGQRDNEMLVTLQNVDLPSFLSSLSLTHQRLRRHLLVIQG